MVYIVSVSESDWDDLVHCAKELKRGSRARRLFWLTAFAVVACCFVVVVLPVCQNIAHPRPEAEVHSEHPRHFPLMYICPDHGSRFLGDLFHLHARLFPAFEYLGEMGNKSIDYQVEEIDNLTTFLANESFSDIISSRTDEFEWLVQNNIRHDLYIAGFAVGGKAKIRPVMFHVGLCIEFDISFYELDYNSYRLADYRIFFWTPMGALSRIIVGNDTDPIKLSEPLQLRSTNLIITETQRYRPFPCAPVVQPGCTARFISSVCEGCGFFGPTRRIGDICLRHRNESCLRNITDTHLSGLETNCLAACKTTGYRLSMTRKESTYTSLQVSFNSREGVTVIRESWAETSLYSFSYICGNLGFFFGFAIFNILKPIFLLGLRYVALSD